VKRAARCVVAAAAGVGFAFTASPALAAPPVEKTMDRECVQTEDGGTICATTRFIAKQSDDQEIVVVHFMNKITQTDPDGKVTSRISDRVLIVQAGSDVPEPDVFPGNVFHGTQRTTYLFDGERCTATFALMVTNGEFRIDREFTEDCTFL
jgi:hypothetical protein